MKRIVFLLLSITIFVTGCSFGASEKSDSNANNDSVFTIVTSFYPMYVFTKNIADGIDGVEVKNMTETNSGCLHDYQLLPGDMKVLETADVFIINGAGMEIFMTDIINRLPNLNIITASDGIELLFSSAHTHENESETQEHSDEAGVYNSHVWLSPENAKAEVLNIANMLMEIDPKNADKYRLNSESYINSIDELDFELSELFKPLEEKSIITNHEAFEYMANRYNFKVAATIQTDHNQSISAAEMARLVNVAADENVILIASEEQYEDNIVQTLSRECGIKVVELNAIVSGNDDYKEVYKNVMMNNANALLSGLDR